MKNEIGRGGPTDAALFGAAPERAAFARAARERAEEPQTAGVVVTAAAWLVTLPASLALGYLVGVVVSKVTP